MISHPLVYSLPHFPSMNALVNWQYRYKVKRTEKALEEGDHEGYVWLHERPYRAEALDRVAPMMSDEAFWRLLVAVWTDTENSDECWELWQELVGENGTRRPGSEAMMTLAERKALADMPDEIIVYRGEQGSEEEEIRDFGWTTSKKVAGWFARRFNKPGVILTGKVKKEDVIAYTNRRNEHEIMAYPWDVFEIREVIFTRQVA